MLQHTQLFFCHDCCIGIYVSCYAQLDCCKLGFTQFYHMFYFRLKTIRWGCDRDDPSLGGHDSVQVGYLVALAFQLCWICGL